jgi:glycosyltransferase involved in cell wall biosynthesis
MNGKLAVLIPVYNGGKLLHHTVASCARSGLHPDSYEILVVDDGSTDGAAEILPTCDPAGALVWVYRNASTLGRMANLQRCIALAEAEGFEYFTFLLAGDYFEPDQGLPALLEEIKATGAAAISGKPASPAPRANADPASTTTHDLMCLNFHLANYPITRLRSTIYRQIPGNNPLLDRSLALPGASNLPSRDLACRARPL